jgi:serine/threonine-protein kinase
MRDINALRTLADHPNIARAVDVFPAEPNCFVMVTEWIDGETLRSLLDTERGRLDHGEVLSLARQTGRGLAYAHNRGVIHRDLRPENIVLTSEGRVKLTNFDCARVSIGAGDTIAGQVSAFWDERYVAPETILAPERASPQSDLYALGIVLFESLTGRRPYSSVSEMLGSPTFALRASDAAPDIPAAWDGLIARLCHFDRTARYQRSELFLADLDHAFASGH